MLLKHLIASELECSSLAAGEQQRYALKDMSPRTRIMYMEYKGEDVFGPARIGRVTFNKTGKSVYYKG